MPRITEKQIETLRLIAEGRISGFRTKDGWLVFHQSGAVCTGAVMALSAKVLVRTAEHSKTVDVEITERGRDVLAKESAPCR